MTTPERGLFDEITEAGRKHHWRMEWETLKLITDKFEQRLAEAEQEVRSCQKDRVDLEVSFCKSSVEKNEEIAQLRARCGELEGVRDLIKFLIDNHLFDDALSWADGIMGEYGTEHASKITTEEGQFARVIMEFDADIKKRWSKAAPQPAQEQTTK